MVLSQNIIMAGMYKSPAEVPLGKGKKGGVVAKGKKGGIVPDESVAVPTPDPVSSLQGVIASLAGANGIIEADDDGVEYAFRTKDVPDEGVVAVGTRVEFMPAPAGKGKGKEGKKEVKFKSIVVLTSASSDYAMPAKEAQEPPVAKLESAQQGGLADEAVAAAQSPSGAGENKPSKERVLRDDEECFVADYTGNQSGQPKTPKFEQFECVRRARIARDLVEMDETVELRIRKHPSKDAEEIRVMTADDMVEVVGTCGEWLRLAGDDEQWIKYMQSENPDIPEQLVDVLGPSFISVASSFTSGWFSSGAAAPQDEKSRATGAVADTAAATSGGGWGFGGWGKSLSSYVPAGAMEKVSAMSKSVLAVGADGEGAGTGGEASLSDTLKSAQNQDETEEDLGTEIADKITKQFDREVKLDEGGLASVRVASQAISMFEGGLGWLGSTASTAAVNVQTKAKSVRETVTSEEFVDKAWSGVKNGVQVHMSMSTRHVTCMHEPCHTCTRSNVNGGRPKCKFHSFAPTCL